MSDPLELESQTIGIQCGFWELHCSPPQSVASALTSRLSSSHSCFRRFFCVFLFFSFQIPITHLPQLEWLVSHHETCVAGVWFQRCHVSFRLLLNASRFQSISQLINCRKWVPMCEVIGREMRRLLVLSFMLLVQNLCLVFPMAAAGLFALTPSCFLFPLPLQTWHPQELLPQSCRSLV